jgi:Putative adhesin
MMRLRFRAFPALLAVAVFAVFGILRAYADAEGHFDRTLSVTGAVDMDVQTGSGDIVVRPGDSGKVEIHGRIRASGGHTEGDVERRIHDLETNPPIDQNGNTIRIGHIDDRERVRNISISYEVIVPAETRLHSSSGSGNERVEGINGPADVNSGSGNITLTNIGGETHARAGSGDIELNGIRGNLKASAGSGSIHGTGIAAGLTASSGSGDVRLEQTAAGDVEIGTGSGSVEVKGARGAVRVQTGSGNITAEGQPTGEWKLRSGSGDVDVEFPADAAYDLVGHTSSGSIHSNQEMTVQGTISPRELHGKVHGGGSLVDLSTSSGSINIR